MTEDIAFAGRTIVITGAAAGIGAAIACALARRGAHLALVDCDGDRLAHVQQELAGAGTAILPIEADLRDRHAPEQAMARVAAEFGTAHGLVNCAGIYPVTGLLDLDAGEWDRVLDTNLRAPALMSQAMARQAIAAGKGGSIVNISSTASVLARPGIAHYGASKAGLNQLTRILAVELAPHGIRVNAVLPGVIGTETVLDGMRDAAAEREMAAKLARIPLGRLGTPAEVVPLVLFLLSDAASYCTGGLFTVDGGFSLGLSRY